jgi:hypothetical protein
MYNFHSEFNNLFNNIPFIKHDSTLNSFRNYSTEIAAANVDEINIFGLDADMIINRVLRQELESTIYREIFTCISNTDNFSYINFIDKFGLFKSLCKSEKENYIYKEMTDLVLSGDYNYVIVSESLGHSLRSSPLFNTSYNSNQDSSSLPYLIGSIGYFKIFISSLLPFDDNRLLMFNEVYFNLKSVNKYTSVPEYRNSKFSFDYDIRVSNSNVAYIIESEESNGYLQYKEFIRDKKLKNILDNE